MDEEHREIIASFEKGRISNKLTIILMVFMIAFGLIIFANVSKFVKENTTKIRHEGCPAYVSETPIFSGFHEIDNIGEATVYLISKLGRENKSFLLESTELYNPKCLKTSYLFFELRNKRYYMVCDNGYIFDYTFENCREATDFFTPIKDMFDMILKPAKR